jgi:hypothetical protein
MGKFDWPDLGNFQNEPGLRSKDGWIEKACRRQAIELATGAAVDLAAVLAMSDAISHGRLRVRGRARIKDLARASTGRRVGGSARPIDKGRPCPHHWRIVNQPECDT